MNTTVEELLKRNYSYEYDVISGNGKTYVLLYRPYTPLKIKDGQFFLDNYYPTFQKLRRDKLTVKDALNASGFKAEQYVGVYKDVALLTGRIALMRNNLSYLEEYGTYFVMEILVLDGEYGRPFEKPRSSPCTNCGACVSACLGGCLQKGFERTLCLRYTQEHSTDLSVDGARLSRYLWGCNACQVACPCNRVEPETKDAPYLDPVVFFESCLAGKKQLTELYGAVLGDNYIRPHKLLALAVILLANMNIRSVAQKVAALAKHPDERVRNAVRYYQNARRTESEREHKLLLSLEEYETILAKADTAPTLQTNLYFKGEVEDTAAVRIRRKAGRRTLTVKVGREENAGVFSATEHSVGIDERQEQELVQGGISAEKLTALSGYKAKGAYTYAGELVTERSVICYGGIAMELDKNRFLGITDYELECETDTAEGDEDYYRFLRETGVKGSPSQPKILRFFNALKN